MAARTGKQSVTATLNGTEIDDVTIEDEWNDVLIIMNVDGATTLGVTFDGTDPVSEDGSSLQVPAKAHLELKLTSAAALPIRVVGDGNKYIVQALP